MEPGLVFALLGTMFGGVGVKAVDRFLGRKKEQHDIASEMRDELREEIAGLKSDVVLLKEEVKEWRGKYYAILEQFILVKGEIDYTLQQQKARPGEIAKWADFEVDRDDEA